MMPQVFADNSYSIAIFGKWHLGRLLDALDASPVADRTVIVVWGDHGWHLGEKEHWGKWTGWQRATHTPLIIVPAKKPPDPFKRDARCAEPVSLLDLYLTLIELCELPPVAGLAGESLVPLLREPETVTGRHVLTTFGQGNYSVTSARWHYIRYADGAEELYDSVNDPHEWQNVAGKPMFQSIQRAMATHLPTQFDSAGNPAPPSERQPAKRFPK